MTLIYIRVRNGQLSGLGFIDGFDKITQSSD